MVIEKNHYRLHADPRLLLAHFVLKHDAKWATKTTLVGAAEENV